MNILLVPERHRNEGPIAPTVMYRAISYWSEIIMYNGACSGDNDLLRVWQHAVGLGDVG